MRFQQALARRHTLQTIALPPQRSVLLHLRDRHAGIAQAQQELKPPHVFGAEDTMAVIASLHAVEQADALVIAQRMRRQAAGFCNLGDGQECGHERSLEVRAHSKSSDFNVNLFGSHKTKRRPLLGGRRFGVQKIDGLQQISRPRRTRSCPDASDDGRVSFSSSEVALPFRLRQVPTRRVPARPWQVPELLQVRMPAQTRRR